MKRFIEGEARTQITLLPECLDDYISEDNPKAVTAAAHKLARLIYIMLTKGEEYTNQGQDYYEERYRERMLRQLAMRAEKIGMKLVVNENPAKYAQ